MQKKPNKKIKFASKKRWLGHSRYTDSALRFRPQS